MSGEVSEGVLGARCTPPPPLARSRRKELISQADSLFRSVPPKWKTPSIIMVVFIPVFPLC